MWLAELRDDGVTILLVDQIGGAGAQTVATGYVSSLDASCAM